VTVLLSLHADSKASEGYSKQCWTGHLLLLLLLLVSPFVENVQTHCFLQSPGVICHLPLVLSLNPCFVEILFNAIHLPVVLPLAFFMMFLLHGSRRICASQLGDQAHTGCIRFISYTFFSHPVSKLYRVPSLFFL